MVAVAHTLLVMAYHVLTRHELYRDLGANYVDERDRQAVERPLVHRLQASGYTVTPTPVPAAWPGERLLSSAPFRNGGIDTAVTGG